MVKIHVKLELIFVFTYQLASDYTTTRIVEIIDSICIGHLRAFSLWTMLKMNLNTNMNSDLTQIIWSKMSVYIKSGCSRAWTKVDGVHTFLCMKISILYVLFTFLALQTSGAHPLLMASTHFFFRTTSLHKTGDQYCTYYHVR